MESQDTYIHAIRSIYCFITSRHRWGIVSTLLLFIVCPYFAEAQTGCNIANFGATTTPSGCTTYTLNGPAGAYWQVAFTSGVSYTFTYASNGNAQAGGMCINGSTHATPYTTNALSGAINIGIDRANTTWNSTSASLTYRISAPTTATAGGGQTDCGLTSTSLGGNTPALGTGTWTQASGGGTSTYSSVNSGSSTATATAYGNYTYTWTINNGGCTSAATTGTITYQQLPAITTNPSATAHTACVGGSFSSISVAAAGTGLTYQWYSNTSNSNSGGTSLGSANGAQTTTYTPQTATTGALYYYCVVSGTCPPSASSNVSGLYTVNPNPTVSAGAGVSAICQGGTTAALGGSFGGGATGAVWSDGGAGGTFTNNGGSMPGTATYTASASSGTPVTLTLTSIGGSCGTATASKSETVNPNPTVNAGAAVAAICQGGTTTALGGSFGGGATGAVWSDGGAGGTFTNNGGSTPGTATYTASASSGTPVTLTLTSIGGSCGTATANKSETVNPTPTPSVSASGTHCTASTFTYTTQSGQSNYIWTIPGTAGTNYTIISGGTSTSNTLVIQWITAGTVTVTVNYANSNGCTGASPASNTSTFNASPTSASIASAIAPCNGGFASQVNITGGTSPYTFYLSCSGWYTGTVPAVIDAAGASGCTLGSITDVNGCPCTTVTGSPVTFGTRALTSGATDTCSVAAGTTQNIFDTGAHLMATIHSGATALGSTIVTVTVDATVQQTPSAPSPGYPDYSIHPQSYLQRHFAITPATSAPANICLYISDAEVSALSTASASDDHSAPAYYQTFATNLSNTNITQYDGGAGTGAQATPGNHSSPTTVITSITSVHNPTVDGYQYNSTWSLCFNVSGFSGFYIHANNVHNDPLPVTLINFTATAIDNKYIRLDWSTASETNNAGFSIERSIDGADYLAIGWADGHSTSDATNDYQFQDLTARPDVVYYYRLRQVDVDGRFVYSPTASATLTGIAGFTLEAIFPNPAGSSVSIGVISNVNTTATIAITDLLGRTVLTEAWPLSIGYNTNQFDLSKLPEGEYAVTIYSDIGRSTKRLVIIK